MRHVSTTDWWKNIPKEDMTLRIQKSSSRIVYKQSPRMLPRELFIFISPKDFEIWNDDTWHIKDPRHVFLGWMVLGWMPTCHFNHIQNNKLWFRIPTCHVCLGWTRDLNNRSEIIKYYLGWIFHGMDTWYFRQIRNNKQLSRMPRVMTCVFAHIRESLFLGYIRKCVFLG